MESLGLSYGDIMAGTLILVRVLAFLAMAPLFSTEAINARFTVMLGLALTIALFPLVREEVTGMRVDSMPWMVLMVGQEVLAGGMIGFTFTLLLGAAQLAGQLMGSSMGMAMANVFDPATGTQANVVANFFTMVTLALVVVIDGHLLFIRLMVSSFEVMPPGSLALADAGVQAVVAAGGHMFSLGARLAFPVVLTLLVMYAAAGIINRAAPQIQVFFVLQPLNISVGLFTFGAAMAVYAAVLRDEFRVFIERGMRLLQTLAG